MKDGAIIATPATSTPRSTSRACARWPSPSARFARSSRSSRWPTAARSTCWPTAVSSTSSCAEGHPANVMDMSFANQALCRRVHGQERRDLEPGVYAVPADIDAGIAKLKLETHGRQDRHAHRRAGEVPRKLAGGHGLAMATIASKHPAHHLVGRRREHRPPGRLPDRPDAAAAAGRRPAVQRRRGRVHGDPVAGRSWRARARRGGGARARAVDRERDRRHRDRRTSTSPRSARSPRRSSSTRPTAVNLSWGARAHPPRSRMDNIDLPLDELKTLVVQEALNMQAEDEERNRQIGTHRRRAAAARRPRC